MRQDKIKKLQHRLVEMRQEYYAEIQSRNEQAASLGDAGVPDIGDMSLTANLRDFLHLLSDAKRDELLRVDEALDKIKDGRYGMCEECEEPIPIERLEVRPFTRYCVACKEQIEREKARQAGTGEGTI